MPEQRTQQKTEDKKRIPPDENDKVINAGIIEEAKVRLRLLRGTFTKNCFISNPIPLTSMYKKKKYCGRHKTKDISLYALADWAVITSRSIPLKML